MKTSEVRGRIVIEKDKCKGCEYCIIYCPKKCIEISRDINIRGVNYAVFSRPEACIACGICARVCPEVCIQVMLKKGGPIYQKVEDTISKLIDSGLDRIKGGAQQQGRHRGQKQHKHKRRDNNDS